MNKYKQIARLIFRDMRSRGGLDIDLDDDIIEEIIEEWSQIIEENL